jgi:FkbM family methyltransferase
VIIGTENPQIVSARGLFGKTSSWMFNLLRHLDPGLILDVGAASGEMTKKMLAFSPHSRVISYEPYPGNWPHYERTIAGDHRAVLRKVAVADKAGEAHFHVASTVTGAEKGWENFVGYSSVGFLAEGPGSAEGLGLSVPTVRIDDEVSEPIRFVKIDVQGGEMAVLNGMAGLLDRQAVDILSVEYDGTDSSPARHLFERGFACLDGGYTIRPLLDKKIDLMDWEITYESVQSTGRPIYGGWPRSCPRALSDYVAWMERHRQGIGVVSTDLVFVSAKFMPQFLRASAAMYEFLEIYFKQPNK